MSKPIIFPPSPFSQQEAIYCANLVDTAYDMYAQWKKLGNPKVGDFKSQWKPKQPSWASEVNLKYSDPIWGNDEIFKEGHPEPFGFVAWTDDGTVYLAIRGTESGDDWIENFEFLKQKYGFVKYYGYVERGFHGIYKSMRDDIQTKLKNVPNPKSLYITGHSLGSSLSTLSVPDIIANTDFTSDNTKQYNFASPKVGDSKFADAYDNNNVVTYRIVNLCDIVPDLPKSISFWDGYEHIEQLVSFKAQYGDPVANHSLTDCYLYALEHPDIPQGSKKSS